MLNVNTALAAMLQPIVNIDSSALAESSKAAFESDIADFLDGHPLEYPMDECSSNGADIGTDCNTFAKAHLTIELAFRKTNEETRIALDSAKSDWKKAQLTCQELVDSAQLDLELAENEAKAVFEEAFNEDSKARIDVLTATMKLASLTARQSYEAAVEAAVSTLSSAAANLITAYSAFVAATNNAKLTAMNNEATAEQTFWQSVENKRDTTP